MAGHSKWANIKHKKEKTDAQRGKIFTKLGREIAMAVKEGGSDPQNNTRLHDVIAKAKTANMPNDTIQRSIKKASGELGNVNYEEIVYEGYGPAGVAIIAECLTDNRNRTAGEMRYLFDRGNGSLGASGCVAWMFDRKGVLVIEKGRDIDEEALMMAALDTGAEDVLINEDTLEVLSDPAVFSELRNGLEAEGYQFLSAAVERIPQTTVKRSESEAEPVLILIEKLEDHDDVQNIYHNLEVE